MILICLSVHLVCRQRVPKQVFIWQLQFLIFNQHIDIQTWSLCLENSVSLSGLISVETVGRTIVQAHKAESKPGWWTVHYGNALLRGSLGGQTVCCFLWYLSLDFEMSINLTWKKPKNKFCFPQCSPFSDPNSLECRPLFPQMSGKMTVWEVGRDFS